ncbi:MAG: hypothetical protein CMJ18_26535 [Phycisphaeraceae bacterium]|nr:hypothetical protein [Phycisphaeraceae bacterium]
MHLPGWTPSPEGEKPVSGQHSSASISGRKRAPQRPMRLMVVSGDQAVQKVLGRCVDGRDIELVRAANLAEARSMLEVTRPDLVLLDTDQPDGEANTLSGELMQRRRRVQTIMLGTAPTAATAIKAMRQGVCDFLVKPLDAKLTLERLDKARLRHEHDTARRRKVHRLQRMCRKLSRVHDDVKQQVDILCKDLVAAYHELAVQMNQVVQSSEYAALIKRELDLEELLRRTLEYLLQKAGPTNAAIFLPSDTDEYTLSGYVNYDCTNEAADFLLEQLADTLAGRVAELGQQVHIRDRDVMAAWMGEGLSYLHESHLIAFCCRHDDEPLAVIAMFRDQSEPFDPSVNELCDAMAPMLADALARLIRIHHRHLTDDDD